MISQKTPQRSRGIFFCVCFFLFFTGLFFYQHALAEVPLSQQPEFALPDAVVKAYPDIPLESLRVAWIGSRLTMAREYQEALRVLREHEKKYPTDPIVSLGEMFVHHCHMIENLDFRFVREFEAAERKNTEILKNHYSEKTASRWQNLIVGAGYGMRGMMFARQQKYLQAATIGYRGFQMMNRVEEQSAGKTPIYDTYFGKGMYHYWMSWAKKRSLIFSVFSDKTEQGLTELKMASEKAIIAAPLATFILAYLYGQENRSHEAFSMLFPLQEKFPKNLIVKTLLGRLYLAEGNMKEGIAALENVLHVEPSYTVTGFYLGQTFFYLQTAPDRAIAHLEAFVFDRSKGRSKSNRSKGFFYLGYIYFNRGDFAMARKYFKEVEKDLLSKEEKQRFDDLRKILKD